jgi:predicted dehydrogenase
MAKTSSKTAKAAPTPKKSGKSKRTRYALVGTGGRSWMFTQALLQDYTDVAELVALCDTNATRMAYYNSMFKSKLSAAPVRAFDASEFDEMVAKTKPDTIIVTSIDRTHHDYIIRALEAGCDVITEKPMTIDLEKCQAILDAVERTGKTVRVTFNYRYSPARAKTKELIQSGAIGEVKAVHFEWLLDTRHGADYFRRWHRDKRNSGGLMVHKSTHHFDLVNWWLDSTPQTVFGMGSLAFYGRANAEARGERHAYTRGSSDASAGDPFALDMRKSPHMTAMYLEAEKDDAYQRDQNVFGDGISIEDTMSVLVRYQNGAQLSYSLVAYCPYEGYRISFTGTKGRLELVEIESSYVNAADSKLGEGSTKGSTLTVYPQFQAPYEVEVKVAEGGHGGGDARLLNDIFKPGGEADPLGRAADHRDGALSILTGIAANQSFATGLPVHTKGLLPGIV